MNYFKCSTCVSMQKGPLLLTSTDYVKNTITHTYRCTSCNNTTSIEALLPEIQRIPITRDTA